MIDVTETARDAGLRIRTLLTLAAWKVFTDHGNLQGREVQKRISMMLDALHIALTQRKGPKENVIFFSAGLWNRGSKTKKLALKAAVENHASEQSLMVMLPDEESGKISKEERKK